MSAGAQTPPASDGIIRMNAREVVLDLVVRDKKGHLVRDLTPGEVSVFEDGVRQKVNSFRNVEGKEQLTAESKAQQLEAAAPNDPTHQLNSLRELNYVSIVFAPMAPANLDFARQAVLSFLKDQTLPNTFVTIFRMDTRLRLLQPFTQDVSLLARAATQATRLATRNGSANFGEVVLSTQGATTALAVANSPAATNPNAQPSLNTSDPTFQRFASTIDASTAMGVGTQTEAMLQSRLRFAESYVTGMTNMDNLQELVRSQANLTGRKIVLYLSDGLALPVDRADVFARLVSEANRDGVTFYTVDTRGLSIESPMANSVARLNQTMADRSLQDASAKGTLSGNPSAGFDSASQTEDLQLTAVSNTQLALAELAARTGGFAVANTNEIAHPMERVMEDVRTHYELAYTPSSEDYNGQFRKIDVRIDRPKVNVQTRRGYYALPELNGQTLQPFEMSGLKAVNARPLPQDVAYDASLLEFQPQGGSVQCQMAFEVPIASLSFQANPKTGKSLLHATLFALVSDSNGQVIRKIGREIFRTVPTAQASSLKDEKIEYAEPVVLAPGHYTVSTAVTDNGLGRTGAKRTSFFVEEPAPLRISSLALVKQVSPLGGTRNADDAFQLEDRRITPTLADTVPAGKAVPLYFVVYTSPQGSSPAPKIVLQLLSNGKELARISPPLPKADATGAIPVVAEISPPAGSYDVRVTVQQGTYAAQTDRSLKIQ